MKISADDETAVNGMGPDIPDDKLAQLMAQFDALKEGDTLVLAGSIPSTLPDDIYEQIMKNSPFLISVLSSMQQEIS